MTTAAMGTMISSRRGRLTRGAVLLLAAFAATACARQSQNTFAADEVGEPIAVDFATVVSTRIVEIRGENTGLGGALGATAGGIALSRFGGGTGKALAILGGALVGVAIGSVVEQNVQDREGIEYTLVTEGGETIVVVQDFAEGERLIQPGERVIIQSGSDFTRVVPAETLPRAIDRPQGIAVVD
ncbi:MAG: hypothetical protein AAFQ88_01745 [Pseudomonadota bacterium]